MISINVDEIEIFIIKFLEYVQGITQMWPYGLYFF